MPKKFLNEGAPTLHAVVALYTNHNADVSAGRLIDTEKQEEDRRSHEAVP
jgi:hypothetical protein